MVKPRLSLQGAVQSFLRVAKKQSTRPRLQQECMLGQSGDGSPQGGLLAWACSDQRALLDLVVLISQSILTGLGEHSTMVWREEAA